ncbi:putative SOS response-associated peptidase YedK [Sphingobium sp. B1D7B]|uniref:SOS response-associated peptidase n=1 Tax=Sphingobium sp. B1D7B TaxID=2940578 RepID=UPI0022251AF7|nr:SOS response-associated peptidase [Sphingobium sp. B1D7B]MCW2406191.1 putative SOS response-associated peptidase YedK [Sphingobium sp. B1D7B]
MCNLYSVKVGLKDYLARFDALPDPADRLVVEKDYVAPGKPGYVVREQDGERLLSVMNWGFPFQGKPVTNVRNYTSPFWKSALANPARRCLVPVNEFQEWSVQADPETGKKRPYWFTVPSQPTFAFAGIWRPTEADPVYSFLTCGYEGDPATHVVGTIHPKACPVILHPEDYDRWLRTDLDDALSLAAPYPSQLMSIGRYAPPAP